ncbi:DUF1588 domain-containing protein [bacterium]|nr:DUF1588 domain-containing protein [bacterium]
MFVLKRCGVSAVFVVFGLCAALAQAEDFQQVLLPLFQEKCVDCHGTLEANAEINLEELLTEEEFLKHPEMINKMLGAIDSGAMPPDGEPALEEQTRLQAVKSLRTLLRKAAERIPQASVPVSRLNRFQYNNTVRDLFQLDRDVFALPEKLMTRHENYLHQSVTENSLPATVQVASHSLQPLPGLSGVKAFPKDLRAEHGFDNQASQLTLSPLLLDAFFRLSVSILESPDFNDQTVGIWSDLFKEPVDQANHEDIIRERLQKFLRIAFRGPVDDETLERYVGYSTAKISEGASFTEGMKQVATAVLSSPLFLYRSSVSEPSEQQFALASRLSYFLWGSCPDDELLQLAESGELSDPKSLDQTISRMLADPKIERFLDSFPSQWMQLENVLAATPDPQINRYFALAPGFPASLQMVLEPLLLFDAVFVENRPIVELLSPEFSYQSEYLKTWYHSDLTPPAVDVPAINIENEKKNQHRLELQTAIAGLKTDLNNLDKPARVKLLQERRSAVTALPLDLKPYARWEFEGDLSEALHGLELTAHGEVQFRHGRVVLNKSYLESKPLQIDLKAKSMEVWFQLADLEDLRGGGLMGIQNNALGLFDTIVVGERKHKLWMLGSNGFTRTADILDSYEETVADELLHLVMVFQEDGMIALYRNGQLYGQPYHTELATFPRETSSLLFGLRHLPTGGNRNLSVSIEQASLYDRALTPQEVESATAARSQFVSIKELIAAIPLEQQKQRQQLVEAVAKNSAELKQIPMNINPESVIQAEQQKYDNKLRAMVQSREFQRIPLTDQRYGGIITNAAMLSMTSGPKRTHPVARGVWVIEVIFNDPPDPPPNDVPPLNEDAGDKNLTIRERFKAHRENPSCAGCHTKLDPLGFAFENFDITGRWRDNYENGRDVDAAGTLMRKHDFAEATGLKAAIVSEQSRFAKAFTEHLMRFALAQELSPADRLVVDDILANSKNDNYRVQTLLRGIIHSQRFLSIAP